VTCRCRDSPDAIEYVPFRDISNEAAIGYVRLRDISDNNAQNFCVCGRGELDVEARQDGYAVAAVEVVL